MYRYFKDNGDSVEFGTYEIVNCKPTSTTHHVIKHDRLARCPFCGGVAAVKGASVYYADGMRIKCQDCGSASGTRLYNLAPFRPLEGMHETKPPTAAEVLKKLVTTWNSRAV